MKDLKHVIFDLDHTLWDFERNTNHVLKILFNKYSLDRTLGTSFDLFKTCYHEITTQLWYLYDIKKICKEELRSQRMLKVFAYFNYKNINLATQLEIEYLKTCPDQPHLIKGTMETLQYVTKKYATHVLTNGFKSTQHRKINASGITKYFETIVTSECSGHSKPAAQAFNFLLEKINANANECIMIGDNTLSDIEGSHKIGMKSIYFNPKKQNEKSNATYTIDTLLEIKDLI